MLSEKKLVSNIQGRRVCVQNISSILTCVTYKNLLVESREGEVVCTKHLTCISLPLLTPERTRQRGEGVCILGILTLYILYTPEENYQ